MADDKRGLRSTSGRPSPAVPSANVVSSPITFTKPRNPPCEPIRIISPGSKLPGLSTVEVKLLREKQKRLVADASSTLNALPGGLEIRNALEATLIFAQYEAGTAVCI